ncbi:hypothetical protein [Prescottella subtropica]|uniref:hypothetical protein n=1 Tax=Prescottella subtropica TaxID=2545757 RepID=UPI0010F7F324|nr:hypothetical protein [Prescottella subtropica]
MTGPEQSKTATIEMLRRRIATMSARPGPPPREADTGPTACPPIPAPTSAGLARDTLSVPAPVAELLPHHGLARGSTVHLTGASSMHAGLVASVTRSGCWAAVVGRPQFGVLATVEMGADLKRCAFCDAGPDPVTVAATLVEGIDLVVLDLGGADIPPTRARAVTARARQHGAVLAVTNGRWPAIDVHLDAQIAGYTRVPGRRGRVTGITLDITATARGRQARRARVDLTSTHSDVDWQVAATSPASGVVEAAQ